MPKYLSQLLGAPQESVRTVVQTLEELCGFPGEDNHFLSDVRVSIRHKLEALGMDPYDTTPEELRHGVLARFENDNYWFSRLLGGQNGPDKYSNRIVGLLLAVDFPREAWVLKRNVAKNILRANPPKKLMKQLKYRSIESMIRREDINELYAALPFLESPRWLSTLHQEYSQLAPVDFEIRQIDMISMPLKRWGNLKTRPVNTVSELGVVALWPAPAEPLKHKISIFLSSLAAIEQLRMDSLFLMSQQTKPNFGKILAKRLSQSVQPEIISSPFRASWSTLVNCYGHMHSQENPILQEPHMQAADARRISKSAAVASLHPAFRWWDGTDFLGSSAGGATVSLNISDAARASFGGNYGEAKIQLNLNQASWDELLSRYIKYPAVEAYVQEHLDKLISPHPKNNFESQMSSVLQREFQMAKG